MVVVVDRATGGWRGDRAGAFDVLEGGVIGGGVLFGEMGMVVVMTVGRRVSWVLLRRGEEKKKKLEKL